METLLIVKNVINMTEHFKYAQYVPVMPQATVKTVSKDGLWIVKKPSHANSALTIA